MSSIQHPHQKRSLPKKLRQALLATTLIASSPLLYGMPALGAIAPAGQVIQNKATGSFIDTDSTEKAIESNVVQVTVAEIAGVSVTATGVQGTPALGSTVFFDFTISNDGNDPTQFFIPGAPSAFSGGNLGTLQVIAYDPDGPGPTNPISLAGVAVPSTGAPTGSLPNSSTFNNGSIPAGATIKVRVPITVTAPGATAVSVTLGDTPPTPANNQDYSTTTTGLKDLYTQDNTGTNGADLVSGDPFNGDSTLHRKEASATKSISAVPNIRGVVFEDVNYGGGSGRALNAPGTSPRSGVAVELYKSDGTVWAGTSTDASGAYTFVNTPAGDYIVRVVNSSVTSSRGSGAGLVPVQTFRTDAGTTAGVVNPVTDRVGGENPAEVDAPSNNASQTLADLNTIPGKKVQSLTAVKVGTTDVTDIDFGYNFDTIVNTKDSGQGSLRQFITNSNALGNATLAQVGQPAGQEVSIFMIPDGNARPGLSSTYSTGLNGAGGDSNTAVITLSSQLIITDNNTSIDGRTQTQNVFDSNIGSIGTGGTVGTDNVVLDLIPKPEIVLNFASIPTVNGNLNPTGGGSNPIVIDAQNTTLAGFAYYGYKISLGLGGLNKGMIWVKPSVLDSGKAKITQLLGGTMADGRQPPTNSLVGSGFQTSGGAEIYNNYFAYLADGAAFENVNGSHVTFYNNELAYNGPQDNNTSHMSGLYADQMESGTGSSNITVRGNLVRNSNKLSASGAQGQGFQMSNSTNMTVENNSFIDNNIFGINASTSDSLIQKNIVTGTKNGPGFTQGSGIIVYYGGSPLTGQRNRISQNSIYQNVKLGIDHQIDGVTPNDGLTSTTKPNNGIDYPIITSSTLSSGTLTVRGYVGKEATPGTGDSDFANVTLEFFIADDDGSNNGKVFDTDPSTVSKPHGEGKTYIGGSTAGNLCVTNASGQFTCIFTNAVTATMTDARNITATATDTAGNTSEFSAPASSNPNLLLVKRITQINGTNSSALGDALNAYNDDPINPYDDNTITIPAPGNLPANPPDTDKWPVDGVGQPQLVGGIKAGYASPESEMEYTIYFLSTGDQPAKNVTFCDRIPDNQTFVTNTYNNIALGSGTNNLQVAPGGLSGTDRGISLLQNGNNYSHTNVSGDDSAEFYPPGSILPAICNNTAPQAQDNGAIVVNLGDVPNALTQTTPGAYGFVRFRVKVK